MVTSSHGDGGRRATVPRCRCSEACRRPERQYRGDVVGNPGPWPFRRLATQVSGRFGRYPRRNGAFRRAGTTMSLAYDGP